MPDESDVSEEPVPDEGVFGSCWSSSDVVVVAGVVAGVASVVAGVASVVVVVVVVVAVDASVVSF